MIGPLAKFVRASNSFKIVLRYFDKVWRKSNVYNTIWLVDSSLSFYLITSQHKFSNRRKTVVSRKKLVMLTNHCGRTSFWWVWACAPHLWFVHLPNWHFSLHLPSPHRPGMCAVENFQRLIFGSLLTSSQESLKHKSMFTFTFTLRTIYEVNVTTRYFERRWPSTNNDAILAALLQHNEDKF